jgi:hypothetical protein
MATGIVSTIAGDGIAAAANGDGGPATQACLFYLNFGIDPADNIYLIWQGSSVIRKIDHGTRIIQSFINLKG